MLYPSYIEMYGNEYSIAGVTYSSKAIGSPYIQGGILCREYSIEFSSKYLLPADYLKSIPVKLFLGPTRIKGNLFFTAYSREGKNIFGYSGVFDYIEIITDERIYEDVIKELAKYNINIILEIN